MPSTEVRQGSLKSSFAFFSETRKNSHHFQKLLRILVRKRQVRLQDRTALPRAGDEDDGGLQAAPDPMHPWALSFKILTMTMMTMKMMMIMIMMAHTKPYNPTRNEIVHEMIKY